jgi:hypothetical protein
MSFSAQICNACAILSTRLERVKLNAACLFIGSSVISTFLCFFMSLFFSIFRLGYSAFAADESTKVLSRTIRKNCSAGRIASHLWSFLRCSTTGIFWPASRSAWATQSYGLPFSQRFTSKWIPGNASQTMSGDSAPPLNCCPRRAGKPSSVSMCAASSSPRLPLFLEFIGGPCRGARTAGRCCD